MMTDNEERVHMVNIPNKNRIDSEDIGESPIPMREIHVKIKNVYGKDTIYPVCRTANAFCALIKQKTFTMYDIDAIKNLGYRIIIVVDPELKTL